jgi:hypothetical protein
MVLTTMIPRLTMYRVSIKCGSLQRLHLQQRHRLFSSPSSKGIMRRQRQQQRQEFQQQHVPKWPAVASILIIPVMLGAWQTSEYVLGNRQIGLNESLRKQFQHEHREMDLLDTTPTLFQCVIRKNTGFTHCLTGVKIGDVVEVLREGVGPQKAYNLCRFPARTGDDLSVDTYGWFPYRWLQKLDHYESIVQLENET